MTSRAVDRDLKRAVMTRRPSRDSKVRVLPGWPRRADTRASRVEDWIAGQFVGSRRSSKSFDHVNIGFRLPGGTERTFMWISLANNSRLGGCSSNTACSKSNVEIIKRSFCPLLPLPIKRSRLEINLMATLDWNDCCSLKNSRNAGSSFRSANFLDAGDTC